MKHLSSYLIVALVAILGLAACGHSNEPIEPPTFQDLIIGSWVCDSCTITMGDKVQDGPMVGAEFTFDADGNLDLSGDAQTYTLQDSTIIFQSSQGMSTEYTISELTETRLTFFKESGPARLTVSCCRKTEDQPDDQE